MRLKSLCIKKEYAAACLEVINSARNNDNVLTTGGMKFDLNELGGCRG